VVSPQGRLFGTNGVRFIPGVSADLGFVIKFAECIGTYFSEGEVLVGRDGRLSGEALTLALTSGLMSSGRDLAEAGLVPTPALQYATKTLGYRGGVMVTASHNPAEYNGLKVVGSDGVEINRLDEQKIEKIFRDGSLERADWKNVGTSRAEPSVIKTYLNGILSKVNTRMIAGRKFSVVMDPGNGAQCIAAPYLLDMLGCKIITINSIIDGRFPARGPEPTPETLGDLSAAVRAVGADLGVAYDGDGDRAIFCDENGAIYWGDQSGSLLADYLLEKAPDATIVTPISSSQVVEVVAAKRRAKVIRTRVGSVDVSRTIIERGAFFGFEENGGCIYPAHIAVRDGGMATALMLECLAARGLSFSKIMANTLPRFFQAKTKVHVPPAKVKEIMKIIEKQAGMRVEKVDGLKIWTDEKTWVLVRPSGTEPIIRIFAESETEEKVNSVFKKFVRLVKSASAS
jgi:phosphomannomutase / phosphoglucomutase